MAMLLDLGGSQQEPEMVSKSLRESGESGVVPEETPRPKSLRPRNSSGSLTS